MIFNCSALGIHNRFLTLSPRPTPNSSLLIIGTTAFSLPFEKSASLPPSERVAWLVKRYNIWLDGLYYAIQQIDELPHALVWIVFLAQGDREILGLPLLQGLDNGVEILYVEVEHAPGAADDYYRQSILPQILNRSLNFWRLRKDGISAVLTCRIDSDDIVHPDYFRIVCECINLGCNGISDITFSYPHGLEYQVASASIIPKVWSEPPFVCRYETLASNKAIKTVWEYPHDRQILKQTYAQIITSLPIWCIRVDGDNIMNSYSDYRYCLPRPASFSGIFEL